MLSPFLGMDPYLEGSHWTGIHAQLCAEIARQLTPLLVPKYVALTNERFVLETPEAVPHVTVEIRDTAQRQLVTAIEVLSPTNKRGEGREEYLAKRRRVLLSTAHLIEIDLLRGGQRVPMRQPLPSLPYFVFIGRFEQRPFVDVYPIAFDQPLPTVKVPLLPGDADCPLDLQQAFTTIYDALRYDLVVDYSQPPEMPLPRRRPRGPRNGCVFGSRRRSSACEPIFETSWQDALRKKSKAVSNHRTPKRIQRGASAGASCYSDNL